jgi:hypothetical protein
MKISNYFLRFNNEYSKAFQQSRLISQIPIFIIAVITLCEIGQDLYLISQENNIGAEAWESIKEAHTFLFLIATLFGGRFLLMFSTTRIAFWFSQIIWLGGFLVLRFFASDLSNGGCTKNVFPMAGETLSYLYVFYMIFSPVRQFLTLFFSLFKVFAK